MMTFRDSLLSMGNVSVIREGGGFGESSMEATKAFSSRSSGWFGNKEHVWPSGPKPRTTQSNIPPDFSKRGFTTLSSYDWAIAKEDSLINDSLIPYTCFVGIGT
mmetsp:Transcript_7293/g.15653  ORF Transcript_7293/g.15653 Transcript_7293/m.15653 type:complete len:104 (+) Transcript_7293:476-787(+)